MLFKDRHHRTVSQHFWYSASLSVLRAVRHFSWVALALICAMTARKIINPMQANTMTMIVTNLHIRDPGTVLMAALMFFTDSSSAVHAFDMRARARAQASKRANAVFTLACCTLGTRRDGGAAARGAGSRAWRTPGSPRRGRARRLRVQRQWRARLRRQGWR